MTEVPPCSHPLAKVRCHGHQAAPIPRSRMSIPPLEGGAYATVKLMLLLILLTLRLAPLSSRATLGSAYLRGPDAQQ